MRLFFFFFPAGLHTRAAQHDPRDVCHSDGNFTERFNTAKFKLLPEYCMTQRLSGGQRRRQTKRHRRTSHRGNFLLRTIRYEDLRGGNPAISHSKHMLFRLCERLPWRISHLLFSSSCQTLRGGLLSPLWAGV